MPGCAAAAREVPEQEEETALGPQGHSTLGSLPESTPHPRQPKLPLFGNLLGSQPDGARQASKSFQGRWGLGMHSTHMPPPASEPPVPFPRDKTLHTRNPPFCWGECAAPEEMTKEDNIPRHTQSPTHLLRAGYPSPKGLLCASTPRGSRAY